MKLHAADLRRLFRSKTVFLVVVCLLLSGCHARDSKVQPVIEFTKVPVSSTGGPDKFDTIEGRVIGAQPDQQLILFARAGTWWVQPMSDQPFTKIQSDASWKNSTHLGTEYAALLVDQQYRPIARMDALPSPGAGVIAVATVKGRGTAAAPITKTIQFSGYEWKVRSTLGERNGSPHEYAVSNASVDSSGFLHLGLTGSPDKWTCSEVMMTRSLGYGTYLFSVRNVSHLEPGAVFNMFIWDELGTTQNHREMDIEVSRWGDPVSKNAQFVIQPYYVPANVSRFQAPPGLLTFSIHWEPGRATFEAFRGNMPTSEARAIAKHVFTSGVPSPGSETVRLNMCLFKYAKVFPQHETEVVIERVQYLP